MPEQNRHGLFDGRIRDDAGLLRIAPHNHILAGAPTGGAGVSPVQSVVCCRGYLDIHLFAAFEVK